MAGAVVATVAVLAGGCSEPDRQKAAATTTVVPTTTAVSSATTIPAPPPTGEHALVAFSSCSSLLQHMKREALRIVTPYGLPSMPGVFNGRLLRGGVTATADAATAETGLATGATSQAAGGGDAFSTTNIQEEGVDEPDILKSDGRRLVTLTPKGLTVVDISGTAPRLLATLALDTAEAAAASELLLVGDRAVVFGHAWGSPVADRRIAESSSIVTEPTSTVRVVDLADPAAPKVVATMRLEGQYVSARLAQGVVRLVVQTGPQGPTFAVPQQQGEEPRMLASNKAAIRRSKVTDWLPTYTLEQPGQKAVTEPLAPCSAVLRPKAFAGLGTVSVLTIDPADPKPVAPACVLGTSGIVYAGPNNLYVAGYAWPEDVSDDVTDDVAKFREPDTQLHRFSIAGREPATYVASGQVGGTVLNQFSMSELDGRLRVAATRHKADGKTESLVYVMEAQDGRLVTIGSVGNLGHEGETIQSVRFIGTRGYVVTFRQTDPLYVIDLADPHRPQVRGELQVPGFSSYLHPLSDTVLLGVGQGPTESGNGQGLQLSLFDVADPAKPVRTAVKVFDNAYSQAQHDHHAFLWWSPTKQLVLPLSEFEHKAEPFTGAMVVAVEPASGFGAVERISHRPRSQAHDHAVLRSMMVGSRLLTLSQAGLMASDAATLDELSWLAW